MRMLDLEIISKYAAQMAYLNIIIEIVRKEQNKTYDKISIFTKWIQPKY